MGRSSLVETQIDHSRLTELADNVIVTGDRESVTVTAPATGESLGTVPRCQHIDVEEAAAIARETQTTWQQWPIEQRAEVLRSFAKLIEEHRSQLLDLLQLETGKARVDALEETFTIPNTCQYYADVAPQLIADEKRQGSFPGLSTATVTYDPVGVVGIISPWNYPLVLSITDAIPALLAGNGVILKPDEKTPYTPLALVELLEQAGAPEGLMTVVTGQGATVGPAVIDESDYVVFTGSTKTGQTVAKRAAGQLTGCLLELGGKNPFIVLEDANIDQTVRGALAAAFSNAGQLCLSAERFYVVEERFEQFLQAFASATKELTVGTGIDYNADVGSLISEQQLDRVTKHVEDAVDRGATVVTGGRARPDIGPYVYEPTILRDVPQDALVQSEETFGPVVTVTSVADQQAAIAAANDSPYGLNASVWTGNRDRGHTVAEQIDCGTVCVNDAYVTGWAAVDAPMGGMGDSGMGYRHGPEGFYQYVQAQTIAQSRIGPVTRPQRLPNQVYAYGLDILARFVRRLPRPFRG